MKAAIFTICVFSFFPILTNAQNLKPTNKVYWAIVNGKKGKEILTKDIITDISQIEDLKVLGTEEIIKRYQKLDANVVLLVTFKPGIKIIKLSEFYALHKIDFNSQKLPISVNGFEINDQTTALVDEKSIHDVKIGTDSLRITTNVGFSKNKQ